MKRDIENRADLEKMLKAFYQKAFEDNLIQHFFLVVVPLDLKYHLPLITDFWESVLFNTHQYRRNVMQLHIDMSHLSPIRKEHLDRWVQLFTQTVDDFFEGPRATLAKQRAASIATLMDMKINYTNLRKL